MMKCLPRPAAILIYIAFASVAGAEEEASTSGFSAADRQTDDTEYWMQTHLFPNPALRRQIERTMAFLEPGESGMEAEVWQLKSEGVLDRRSSSKIRNALDHARGSMTRVSEGIDAEHRMDGWTARMIAYELGMAADTLTQQAKPIEPEPNAVSDDGDSATAGTPSETDRCRHLARSLRESSYLLKETARAIVRNLR